MILLTIASLELRDRMPIECKLLLLDWEMFKRVAYAMSFTYPCPRKLREIMKISMIEREPAHQVESIWKDYHSPRINNTCSVLDKEKYNFFKDR